MSNFDNFEKNYKTNPNGLKRNTNSVILNNLSRIVIYLSEVNLLANKSTICRDLSLSSKVTNSCLFWLTNNKILISDKKYKSTKNGGLVKYYKLNEDWLKLKNE